jgi:hypothetical protein
LHTASTAGQLVAARGHARGVTRQGPEIPVIEGLLAVGQRLEPVEHEAEVLVIELEAQLDQPPPQGSTAGVLAQHQRAAVPAHGLGRHDLVRRPVLDDAVLVDPGLVRERVGAHDGLVGRDIHTGAGGHQAR